MWKYKEVVLCSALYILVTAVCTWLIGHGNLHQYTILDILYHDYTYMFAFSALIFMVIKEKKCINLILHRHVNYSEYVKVCFVELLKRMVLFTIINIVALLLLFRFVFQNSDVQFLDIVAKNIVLFCMAVVSYLVTMAGRVNNYTKRYILCFILWNLLIVNAILTPDSMIQLVNPFSLLLKFDSNKILSYVFLYGVVVYSCMIRIKDHKVEL